MPKFVLTDNGAIVNEIMTADALDETSFASPHTFWVEVPATSEAFELGVRDPNSLRRSSSKPAVKLAAEQLDRLRGYEAAGATQAAMVVALWERVVENRPQATSTLQAAREVVKARVPITVALPNMAG